MDGQTTQLANVSGSVVAELGSQTTAYYRANGKVLYAKTGTTIANYTYNGHGDVVKAGSQTYTYDAFGNQRNPSDNDTNPFRYCGEYWDGESGQVYLRARYYAPAIGRFTASDPARDGANWYVYCGGNPVMWVDPSGYLREGYTDENGVYHADPDAEEFGKDSMAYSALTTLGDMWMHFPKNRSAIESLANEVRRIARQPDYLPKLLAAKSVAPESANHTDIIIAAGHPFASAINIDNKNFATAKANEYYSDRRDGTKNNAFKHTLWNALNTYALGEKMAKWIGDAHEFGARENISTDSFQISLMEMDLYNNGVGRLFGSTLKPYSASMDPRGFYKDNLSPSLQLANKVYAYVEGKYVYIVQ